MIRIRRSESTVLKFQRKQADDTVILTTPDDLWFAVKKYPNDTHYVLQKKLSNSGIAFDSETGWYRIELTPADTDPLDFGIYYCDLKKREGNREKYLTKMLPVEICEAIIGQMQK